MIYPIITLYQPWATWIALGLKTIETRTHPRFSSLMGKRILIHAGKAFDKQAMPNPFLSFDEEICDTPPLCPQGVILCSAIVSSFGPLNKSHSQAALIDCEHVQRYGLFLSDVHVLPEPIPENGERGIWYYDLTNKCKAKWLQKKVNNQLF